MKNTLKRLLAVLLILTLTTLIGCGGVNNLSSLDSVTSAGSDLNIYSSITSNNSSVGSTLGTDPSSGTVGGSSLQNITPSNGGAVTSDASSQSQVVKPAPKPSFDLQGIWLSCFEMPFMWDKKTVAEQKIDALMQKISANGYNAVFCHVRPYADALYPSNYFPFSKYASGTAGADPGYDPLKVMLTAAKKYNLQFHAWINPYRVTKAGEGEEAIADSSIAKIWLNDGSGRAVNTAAGVYLNPASADVKKLVLNGVKEVLNNYKVDGIHFDDYFYPTTDQSFDAKAYTQYKQSAAHPLSLADWRRANVSALVASVYSVCKSKGVAFGISPAGDISLNKTDRNYTTLYADIPLWMSTPGYVDYLIPQIYFGYNYPKEKARYSTLLNTWVTLKRHSGIKLYVGLGAYKMDEPCEDSAEWQGDDTLLARQVTDAYNKGMSGAVAFSCSAVFSEKQHNINQMNNMYTAIKNIRSK